MSDLLSILVVLGVGFWLYSKFTAASRKVERTVDKMSRIAAPPPAPVKRQPRKPKAPAAGPSIKPLLDFKADVELTCGHPSLISPFGLSEDAVATCETCGASGPIGDDAFDEALTQFNDEVTDQWGDRDLEPHSGAAIEFMRINRRKPKAGEVPREPSGYPVGLVGEQHRQDAIAACAEGDEVELEREPGNPHDPCAILARNSRGAILGYVPREHWLHDAVCVEGQQAEAEILQLRKAPDGTVHVVLDVEVARRARADHGRH